MISCCVFNLLQYRFSSSIIESQVLAVAGSPTLISILGSRMMFSLREAAEYGVNIGTSHWTLNLTDRSTLTDMDFAWGRHAMTHEYVTRPVSSREQPSGPDSKGKMVETSSTTPI